MPESSPADKITCPVCGSEELESLFDVHNAPVHCGILWKNRQAALDAPEGEISLTLCLACSHVFNRRFDPDLMQYEQPYDNNLFFSPRFQEYARYQADRLISTYQINKKNIIEVGSGKGDFLELICELGDNHGIGFDPSYTPDPGVEKTSERIQYIADYFTERYSGLPADLIYSRHTLEHIQQPVEFLSALRKTAHAQNQTVFFLEVPNCDFGRKEIRPWDILYEHCAYFNPRSLFMACQRSGFEVLQINEAFVDQFLTIDSRLVPENHSQQPPIPLKPLHETIQSAKAYSQNYHEMLRSWREKLEEIRGRGWKTVIWGAGAKGLSFLTMLDLKDQIRYAVDINPGKWGKYMPKTGQEIIPPDFLRTYQPDVIIIMNPNYQAEIKQSVENMGLNLHFWCA